MAYGQGSVYKDEARGLWVGQVELGEIDGKRQRRRTTAKTKAAVVAKMRAIQNQAAKGLPVANQITTTGDWLNWWAAEILPRSVEPTTLASYRWILGAYVIPNVGHVPLTKLAPEHVEAMMRKLEGRGLSPRTIAYSRAILRRGLAIAMKRGKVALNVAALVDAPPKAASRLDDALDAAGASAVLLAAAGDRLEALAVLVLAVGLRQGEALSLRWEDVDLESGSVTVTKSKTDAGERTIALPAFVVSALRAHQARQKVERMAAGTMPSGCSHPRSAPSWIPAIPCAGGTTSPSALASGGGGSTPLGTLRRHSCSTTGCRLRSCPQPLATLACQSRQTCTPRCVRRCNVERRTSWKGCSVESCQPGGQVLMLTSQRRTVSRFTP